MAGEPAPQCPQCHTHITVDHILIECPIYMHERATTVLPETPTSLLADKNEQIEKLFTYLNATGLIHEL